MIVNYDVVNALVNLVLGRRATFRPRHGLVKFETISGAITRRLSPDLLHKRSPIDAWLTNLLTSRRSSAALDKDGKRT